MTKEEIEDYLYFFLAPLLKANTVGDADMDSFQQMIILTLSQASVYIEAPGYTANTSSREFSNEIINEISDLSDKIFANIPDRTTDDSYWLKITVSALLAADISAGDTYLQAEKSFGSFSIDEEKSISFDFYYVAHQLQLRLPTTAEISAIISTKKPVTVADGAVTNIDIAECTLWLSAIHFDASVADATFYLGVRLKKCNISFDSGYTKSGNRISADLFVNFAKFVITCIPENEIPDGLGSTVAAGNTVVYPDKFVFTFQHRPGLPQPPKITLTHAEPFSSTLFGSAVNTISATDISSNWIADKKLLSFPLQVEDDVFAATENASPVFNLKGNGKIANPAWYFSVVSTNHPLGFGRLGIGSESGYIGFDIAEEFSLAWNGLQNAAIKLKDFFIRTSPDTLFINYTYDASMLAKQQLKLWPANEKKKGRSAIELNYAIGGTGSFTSHRKSIELHRTQAGIDVNIDRPVLSNGDRIFLKTTGGLMLINNKGVMTALVSGGPMDPSVAFENNAFKQLRSFALSNALIVVKPIEIFFLIGKLNAAGIAVSGQSIITFPVSYIEHTLPDPYITSLFNDQPIRDNNVNPTQSLMATVRWNETDDAELIMQLTDENGNVFTPKSTMTDDRLAEILLDFPLRHPGEAMYENSLRDAMASKGIAAVFFPDELPYSKYKPLYHSNINAAGAFSALHILPGNVSLVDLSGSASQMGIAFYRRLDNTENRIDAVLENTGYTINQMFRIANNELVSSGRFVRAFTLPHVQWEPVYFEEKSDGQISFDENDPYPTHGVPTRISSANKTDVTLAPLPVTKYIIEGFKDDKNKYAAAAHFALPFGMNAVALFHPFVAGADAFAEIDIFGAEIINPDSFSFSILNFNQPAFNFKKEVLSGAIQIKATSEGYPNASRDKRPDPSFHGAVLQAPNQFNEVGIVPREDGKLIIQYKDDSILGDIITKQFNKEMWGEYISSEDLTTLNFNRSTTAKVPLRRIDFSGLGASIFSNWFDKTADAGAVSQVKFNILIGRVAHEVVQIKSSIVPFFVPVVRTIIIERKNHGNVIRKDSGWVATGPGVFHHGYACHPGVVKGVYNVTSIKDREISIPQKLAKPGADGNDVIVDMAGVYYDADVLIENVVSGFKNTIDPVENNHKLVPSKKQFGYIILGNNASKSLEEYYTDEDLKNFMSSSDVGSLGGPVDCVLNIAGSDQFMHLTRVDVTIAATAKASVAAARGTLQLPKGGSWSVVKKVTNGVTSSLRNDETVPLIRNGILKLEAKTQKFLGIDFNGSLHVLGNPLNIDKYEAGKSALADI
ncbi:MAG: hypothetical protein ABJA35_05945, partial [Parafilimonas sp.]